MASPHIARLRLSALAEEDVRETADWYGSQRDGLDLEFRDDLRSTLDRIRAHPLAFPILRKNLRRANLKRFPYGVFYRERSDDLFVIAILRHSRHPRLWKRRAAK